MKLYIMRHGPAVKRGTAQEEFSRPLSPQGEQQTAAAARGLGRLGLSEVRILSSPLTRAVRTAEIVAAELARGVSPERVEALAAGATSSGIHKAIKGFEGDLLIVGHEPDLGALVTYFLGCDSQSCIDFSKAGVVALEFEGPPQKGSATLLWFLRRRHLELLGQSPTM